jgi:hypothetical protein
MMSGPSAIEQARRINRTWTVRGDLAGDAADYLALLEKQRPATLLEVCTLAVAAAREASHKGRDPKPDFYASLFCRATPEEREIYLKNHLWTRERAGELQAKNDDAAEAPPRT